MLCLVLCVVRAVVGTQVLLGALIRPGATRGRRRASVARGPWVMLHHAAGRGVIVLACANVCAGIWIYHLDPDLGVPLAAWAVPVVCAIVGLQVGVPCVLRVYRRRIRAACQRGPTNGTLSSSGLRTRHGQRVARPTGPDEAWHGRVPHGASGGGGATAASEREGGFGQ